MNEDASVFLFPLRTNVEYFSTSAGFLTLEGRVKQALIMYDRVVFEGGMYTADMGPDGTFDTHLPVSQLPSRADRQAFEGLRSSSDGFSVWAQPTGSAEPFQLVLASSVERRFRAEFHSLHHRLTTRFGAEGLELADLHLSPEGADVANNLASEYLNAPDSVLPDGSAPVQTHIVKNFFKDLILTSSLGCASSMDALHAPMLDRIVRNGKGFKTAPGRAALEFLVPHVASLTWEQLSQARNEPAVREFRRKLATTEQTVRAMLPEASEIEIRHEVGSILTRALVQELAQRMAPREGRLVGTVAVQVAGGVVSEFVPVIGLLQTGAEVTKAILHARRDRRSWLAVLMKLSHLQRS